MPKKIRGEPFCAVFQKISGSEIFMDKRGGVYQDFPSKNFCLTLPRNFVGEPISVSLVLAIDNFYGSEG